jgi:hypothetical protein
MPETTLDDDDFLHVLFISFHSGESVTLHLSEDDAIRSLASYCREFWDDASTGEPAPDDDKQAIGLYFRHAPGESYTIVTAEIPEAAGRLWS